MCQVRVRALNEVKHMLIMLVKPTDTSIDLIKLKTELIKPRFETKIIPTHPSMTEGYSFCKAKIGVQGGRAILAHSRQWSLWRH